MDKERVTKDSIIHPQEGFVICMYHIWWQSINLTFQDISLGLNVKVTEIDYQEKTLSKQSKLSNALYTCWDNLSVQNDNHPQMIPNNINVQLKHNS